MPISPNFSCLASTGSGPVCNINGKPINVDSLATTGSAQSGSSTTDLQDSISAVRSRAGNLIDNPTAPQGSSQIQYGKAEPELAEDPMNKDMEDLVRSMQTSLPSRNAESPSAPASAIAALPSYSQGTGVQASAAMSSSGQNQGHRKSVAPQAA